MPDTTTNTPADGQKTARLAHQLYAQCLKANLNNLEITTALGLVAETVFRDIPEAYLTAWVATLRSHLGHTDA